MPLSHVPAPDPPDPAAAGAPGRPGPSAHQRIRELARLPRGKAWASRLCAFEDAIRAQRKVHQSYREIAAWLETQGLRVSASSVHGFVKARAQRKRPLYTLPEPLSAAPMPPGGAPVATADDAAAPTPARKEYVFIPKPKRPSFFSDEDLQFNDPLAIDTFGKPVPVDPDAENPFKMRKRKAP